MAAFGFVWGLISPSLAAAALIVDLTGQHQTLRAWLPVRAHAVSTRDLDVPARHGAIHARLYLPDGADGRALAVFPGVHGGGVDEPRMSALCRKLASSGIAVLAAPLPELRQYIVRPRSTDDIEDVAGWLAAQPDIAPTGRIGLVGVSFAGGLALVAAGRPSLADRLALVATIGGYGDLPRTMRYLLTGVRSDGSRAPAHDYGAVVILLAGLAHVVPADQVEPLRRAVVTFLDGSSNDITDPARAARLFDDARAMGRALPEPARTVMGWVSNRNVDALGPALLPYVEELGGDAALSPERSPATRVPVFLLHGEGDNVIPPTEAPLVADYLKRNGNGNVRVLLTPLIAHANVAAEPAAPAWSDVWRLVRFWAETLRALPAR